jgi:hypothetical protein
MKMFPGAKRLFVTLLALSLLLGCLALAPTSAAAENPLDSGVTPQGGNVYTIATAEQLQRLSSLSADNSFVGVTFRLTANIDINPGCVISSDGSYTGSLTAFTPIGTASKPFKGTFDGNGYTIRGLYISDTSGANVGLFGNIYEASIKDVTIANSYISGNGRVGAICGYANSSSSITGCTNRAYVTGDKIVGGICGELTYYSTISSCGNEGAVSSDATAEGGENPTVGIGGICGVVSSDTEDAAIQTSYNLASISASCDNVGGIAGYSCAAIETSYNAGTVSGKQFVGGICGCQSGKIIQNVYNLESISGLDYIGGIVGYASANVSCAYSIGEVNAQGDNHNDISGSSYGETDVYTIDSLKKSNTLPAGFSDTIWEMQENGAEYSFPALIGLANPNLQSDTDGALMYPITLGSQSPSVPLPAEQSADVKVEYRAAITPSTVYSVDVKWGSMAFVYTEGSAGTWNPNTHSYEGQTASAWTCASGANVVTITNHSNTALTAKLSYQPAQSYSAVQGSFSATSLPLASAVNTTVNAAPTATSALTLQGSMPASSDIQTVVGKVSIIFE